MRFTLQLTVLLGLSFGLFVEGNALCKKKGGCCKRCPNGWMRFRGRCYMFINAMETWCDAETACVEAGGNLASLHSEEEVEMLRDIVVEKTGTKAKVWLGGYDQVQQGCWLNSDGSKFNSSFWGPGEPNNKFGIEGCMQLHNEPHQPVNDAPCNVTSAFFCAVDPEEEEMEMYGLH